MLDSIAPLFHHHCIRTMLHITNKQQWEQHITSRMIRERWGDVETVTDKIRKRRLEWLGYIARMPEHRTPKLVFFGWLPHARPPGGPRKRWKDQIRADLKAAGISEGVWYEDASSRTEWRANYCLGLESDMQSQLHQSAQPPTTVICHACGRSFRPEGDKKGHKCIQECMGQCSAQVARGGFAAKEDSASINVDLTLPKLYPNIQLSALGLSKLCSVLLA